jgi:AraC-like DNA-binding protein
MGLLEWVVPVPGNDGPVLVLFAGPCLPKPSLEADAVDRPSRRLHVLPALRRVDAAESRAILESLHQLGARLRWWLAELKLRTGHVDHAGPDGARRERVIRQFVHEHHTEPVTQRDLAQALRLSPSRCAHVVRLVTGKTLRQLLYDARVETACWLLAQTDLPLKQIVRRVRIHDPSYFHRLFRQRTGLTPARYRRQHRT